MLDGGSIPQVTDLWLGSDSCLLLAQNFSLQWVRKRRRVLHCAQSPARCGGVRNSEPLNLRGLDQPLHPSPPWSPVMFYPDQLLLVMVMLCPILSLYQRAICTMEKRKGGSLQGNEKAWLLDWFVPASFPFPSNWFEGWVALWKVPGSNSMKPPPPCLWPHLLLWNWVS